MVTKEEILGVSKVAKIAISDEEAQRFTKEINDVLKFVDMIEEVVPNREGLAVEKGVCKDELYRKNTKDPKFAHDEADFMC